MTKIAIDCMGGDHGLSVTIPAALSFLHRHSDVFLYLVGPSALIEAELVRLKAARERLEIVHAEDAVLMSDSLEVALRHKKKSSMRLSAELVRDQIADACISAGNTGAWMAIARYVLKTMDGVDRPAIATFIPTQKKPVTMLDLGANVDCSAQHLLQFAIMGVAFSQAVEQHERPSVGLLNVGEELIKGNEVVKETAEFLRRSPLNFYGNVEGDDIYKGTVDVIVCDGFVGNAVLKSSEGLARMFVAYLSAAFYKNIFTKLVGLCVRPVLKGLRYQLDHRRYNGAALLGLRGIVFKSHGSADAYAFECALERARLAVSSRLLEKIANSMQSIQAQLAQSEQQESS